MLLRADEYGGQGNWRTAIQGISPDYQLVRDWPVASGRFFDSSKE